LQWKYVCGVSTDGDPAMMGSRSGFQKKFKNLLSKQKVNTCVLLRCAIAGRTSPTPLKNVLDSTMRILITLNLEALKPACFRTLQRHEFDTRRSCISHICTLAIEKRNVLHRVCVMKNRINFFSELKTKKFLSCINDKIWLKRLAYSAKIFEKLKTLNLKLQ